MKNQILLIAALCLCACRTRQVSTVKTATTDRSAKTEVITAMAAQVDTTKTTNLTTATSSGNSTVEVDIVPDTGTVIITNGNYTGKARNITIKGTLAATQTTSQLIQQAEGVTAQTSVRNSTKQKDDIQTQSKTKQVIATGLNPPWFWLAALAGLIGSGWLVIKNRVKIEEFV